MRSRQKPAWTCPRLLVKVAKNSDYLSEDSGNDLVHIAEAATLIRLLEMAART